MARSFFVPVILAASTTAGPALRFVSGTAPSSPTNGDMWFDGQFRVRRVGATYGLAYTDAAQTFSSNNDFTATVQFEDLRAISVIMGAY